MGIEVMVAMAAGQAILGASRENARSKAQNKAIMKYNEKLQYESMQTVNQMNLQRAQLIQQQQDALFNINVTAQSQESAVVQQAAATDTIGASISDAIGAVNTAASLDIGQAKSQFSNTMTAWEMQKKSQLRQAQNDLQEPDKNRAMDAIIDGALNIGGMLAMNSAVESMNKDMSNAYAANAISTAGRKTDLYGTQGTLFNSVQAAVSDAYTKALSGRYHGSFSSNMNSSLALNAWARRYT